MQNDPLKLAQTAYLRGALSSAAAIVLYHKITHPTAIFILARLARQRADYKLAEHVVSMLQQQQQHAEFYPQILSQIVEINKNARQLLDIVTHEPHSMQAILARERHELPVSGKDYAVYQAYQRLELSELHGFADKAQLRRLQAYSLFTGLLHKRNRVDFENYSNQLLTRYQCTLCCLASIVFACGIANGLVVGVCNGRFSAKRLEAFYKTEIPLYNSGIAQV